MNILLTGGAGYIGTHTAIQLIQAGHSVIIVDNFCNSSPEAVRRVEQITGTNIPVHDVDVCDETALNAVFEQHTIDGVIHFAGLKAVGESVEKPLHYYQNNLIGTLSLVECMQKHSVNNLVFSSSATVYGSDASSPITEKTPAGNGITNPYGRSKYIIEEMLRDISAASPDLKVTILRYFNPVGAHESGKIGEDPSGKPNNLLPFVTQVAVGKREKVMVFGDDYDTTDGTGVRDYIHVIDLADGHVAALEKAKKGVNTYNLGSGKGTSVLELIHMFSTACGHDVPYEITARRPGDIATCYANATKAKEELGWTTQKTVQDACNDSWQWQSQNPNGYKN